jgi:glycosyltransferase involved in cell wall biosynthesis
MGRKVCILTTVHPPFDTRIFHKQAKTLAKAGYDVTLIAQHEKSEVAEGVKIIPLPKPRNRFQRFFGLTWQTLRLALRQHADIYHFHDPELLPIGVLLKLFTRAKVIYDVHEDVPKQILTKHWVPAPLRCSLAVVFSVFEKALARVMDAVVVATEDIAAKFVRFKPVVVHNFPDLRMLSNPSPAPLEGNEKVVIYVGGISRIRGAFEMVRALEYLDHSLEVRLDLIGKFEPPALEFELQMLPGYRQVRYLGWMQPGDVYVHLAKADIGLVCLHPEPRFMVAWPVKLFEYMAAGLPVIASDFPLWKEIVEGNECGLTVNPLDPKEIAAAIEYLIEHPEERRRMGENGRRAVLEKYNWEREAQKLLAVYKRLLREA